MRQQIAAAIIGATSVTAGVQALPLQASAPPAECSTPAGILTIAARNAGLPADRIVTAVAVAGAESGYRLGAEKVDWVESSYGPWQVNRDAHPQYGVDELKTPAGAARAMFEISGAGENFGPWTMYVNGGYKAHLVEAEGVAHCAGADVVPTPAGVLEGGTRGGYRPPPGRTVGNLLDSTVTGVVDAACRAAGRAVWAQDACRRVNQAMSAG